MQFLEDTYLTCQDCDGRRYAPNILEVTYDRFAMDDVLNSTVSEAVEVFREPHMLAALPRSLDASGLGHLTLGQSSTTLSGGEAQRIKLARAALRGRHGDVLGLLILDEPLAGLHPGVAQRLMATTDLLLERSNTVVIAEHDIHAAASADWIIDLGPGSGDGRG